MSTSALPSARSLFESALPTAIFAGGGIMSHNDTGQAVLMCLAGGSFLLQLWLGIKKAGAYNKQDRREEVKAANADMVSRQELDRAKADLHKTMADFRTELKNSLDALTRDFNETTRDMTHAIGRLQALHEQAYRDTPRRSTRPA